MQHEVVVIGGSYAGLSAAMQLARALRRVLVIDSGSPRNRFARAGHGFLGQDGRAPLEIKRSAASQLEAYPSVTQIEGEVIDAAPEKGGFAIRLLDGAEHNARRVVLATGLRDELPDIPGMMERWGETVLHCPYCHGYEVSGRQLGVVATSPMSIHQAGLLPDWGPTTLFTQGKFEPSPEQAAHLADRGVKIEPSPVVELLGRAPALEAVRLQNGRVLPMAAVFTAPRTHMSSPIAQRLGCAFDDAPFGPMIRVDDWKQTTVPGVYAAGDAASAMHNATLASASGVLAGIGAHQSLARS